ncbi:putative Mitochondrial arginine transporter BAC2 [Cocos nucifera]|uniref:Putative Mitochondrial arginine transporter BAC2 n=1 Tax=Cocos nucifera TaxID=13894 RepID=A0A8K0N6Z7_COCNU|nr:putative Mitochondrial arginine transporter BAC2 [Cocos nucifera]
MVVLKTCLQVTHPSPSCIRVVASILRHECLRGFYKGFTTSLTGTIPARALYVSTLEVTKSAVGTTTV